MDGVWEFFRSMTIWNWLALVAFIFFPLSALNSFLSLRSRYLDWSSIRSKRKFEKRLQQLRTQLNKVREYRNTPTSLLLDLVSEIAFTLYFFLIAFFSLVMALTYGEVPPASLTFGYIFQVIFYGFSILATVVSLVISASPLRLIRQTRFPELVAERMIKLVSQAKLKGWIAGEDDTTINFILNHNVFTDLEMAVVKKYLGKYQSPSK